MLPLIEVKKRSFYLCNDGRGCCDEALVDETNNEDYVWKRTLLRMELDTLR